MRIGVLAAAPATEVFNLLTEQALSTNGLIEEVAIHPADLSVSIKCDDLAVVIEWLEQEHGVHLIQKDDDRYMIAAPIAEQIETTEKPDVSPEEAEKEIEAITEIDPIETMRKAAIAKLAAEEDPERITELIGKIGRPEEFVGQLVQDPDTKKAMMALALNKIKGMDERALTQLAGEAR